MATDTKHKILNALGKKFNVTYSEEVKYSIEVYAVDEEEVDRMWEYGEINGVADDIIEGEYVEGSLEIEEISG